MPHNRQLKINRFLLDSNVAVKKLTALAQDASFRQYYRVFDAQKSFILMDAPVEHEDIRPFIKIAQHLHSLKLRAPEILNHDQENGFILLEDLGDDTFTRLLAAQHDERGLYLLATQCLIELHRHPQASEISLTDYSTQKLIDEALLLCDWYYPQATGTPITNSDRDVYVQIWQNLIQAMPCADNSLVLRDFHVDNLIKLNNGECGLLDFQDAVIGPKAYDLVSLLQDARRDIAEQLETEMLNLYLSATSTSSESFNRWYWLLGAQRHCKVLGIFSRLSKRDQKHHYLEHLPRVERLLLNACQQTELTELKDWLQQHRLLGL